MFPRACLCACANVTDSGGTRRGGEDHHVTQAEVLVILPTYNERGTLVPVIERVLDVVPEAEVLVIDDASPDGTGEIADDFAARDRRVRVLHREGKRGLGAAYLAGFRHALAHGHRLIIAMDADGSHLAEELPMLIGAANRGAARPGAATDAPGLVIGTRWIAGGGIVNWPWYRRLISRTGTAVARLALRSGLHDITSGFRVYDANWLRRLDLDAVASEGYVFQVETAWRLERAGCPIAEVPITFVERTRGRSKMSFGIVAEALGRVLFWGLLLRLGHPAPPTRRSGR